MANQRLNATISIGGTVDKSLTRGITNTKGQIGDLGASIGKSTRRQAMLSREIGRMGRQGGNVEPLRRQYAALGEEIDTLRRKQRNLQRFAAADVGGRFGKMTREVGTLVRRTAITGAAVGAGLFGVASSTAQLGDDVAKTADKLGMGIGELQEYRYAAERSGVASKTFDQATQRMVRRVAEAARGSGEAKDAIKELGLSAETLASMTPDEQLNHFADALQNVENHGDKVRLAMKLFDSEGVAMVNMLRDGSEGLEQFAKDARRTGYVMSDQAVRDAETFQDNLLNTKLSLFGLKNIIGAELMPVVSDMMGRFTGWLADNRDQVREWATTFANRLESAVPAIASLATGIGNVVFHVGRAIDTTAKMVGGFENLGMIIGGLFATKAVMAVGGFAVSLFKAGAALGSLTGVLPAVAKGIGMIGKALFMNPIGLTLMAVAGAGYLIYRNWETIGPWFSSLWQGIKDSAAWAWDGLKSLFSWSPLGMVIENWGGISEWFSDMWDGITAKAGEALDWIAGKLEWVGNAFNKVKGWLSWGDDASADEVRSQLGGGNAGSLGLGSMRSGPGRAEQEERGRQAAAASLPPTHPRYRGEEKASKSTGDKIASITNQLTLNVNRSDGEADSSYARRIAEMVMDELNGLQQGALYD